MRSCTRAYRVGVVLTYDAENRLTQASRPPLGVTSGGTTTTYAYDGDGNRLKRNVTSGGTTTTTYYVGNYFEVTGSTVIKYYYLGGQRVAMNQNGTVYYLHGDHLGSTNAVSGAAISRQTYYAYGLPRTTEGTLPTDRTFTGQVADSDGLMYYGARYYEASLNRWTQPDSIIPDWYNPQSLNRYSYTRNNPVKYTDPTGHFECEDANECNDGPEPPIPPPPSVPESPQGGDSVDPWQVGMEWLTGQGPRHHEFREGDIFTELLKTHKHLEETREKIAKRLAARNYRAGENDYSVAGLDGVPKYFGDYSNVLTFGHTGNIAVTFLGSYNVAYFVINVDSDSGIGEVLFHVSNESNLASATHPPVLGYTPFWRENVEPKVNELTATGPMSPVTQDFWWRETIRFK